MTTDISKRISKDFNWSSLWVLLYAILGTILQFILMAVLGDKVQTTSWGQYVLILFPLHIISVPVIYYLASRRKHVAPVKHKLSVKQFIGYALVMAFFTGVGLTISSLLSTVVDLSSAEEAVTSLTTGDNFFLRVLTVGISAPIAEEIIFRKMLIDPIYKYSEKFAVIFSGLLFGLFHGNFVQFFFAAFIGVMLSYVYIKTGNILYSIALHMCMNLTTSVITAYVGGLENDIIMAVWSMVLSLIAVVGAVVFIINCRKITFKKHIEEDVPAGTLVKAAFLNVSTIIFILYCFVLIAASFLM